MLLLLVDIHSIIWNFKELDVMIKDIMVIFFKFWVMIWQHTDCGNVQNWGTNNSIWYICMTVHCYFKGIINLMQVKLELVLTRVFFSFLSQNQWHNWINNLGFILNLVLFSEWIFTEGLARDYWLQLLYLFKYVWLLFIFFDLINKRSQCIMNKFIFSYDSICS